MDETMTCAGCREPVRYEDADLHGGEPWHESCLLDGTPDCFRCGRPVRAGSELASFTLSGDLVHETCPPRDA